MRLLAVALLVALVACDGGSQETAPTTSTSSSTTTTTATTTTTSPDPTVPIRYRVERRPSDPLTAGFEATVMETLTDPKGWARAGFRFEAVPDGEYLVVLAEGPEVDTLCFPYETETTYSCQNGPVVALNAERWRSAHPKWTGDLTTYRQMLVNHEVGHLIGMHHPDVQCPQPGHPAPVMAQQTTELDGCRPNPWPLAHEVERAARHDLKIAPEYGE